MPRNPNNYRPPFAATELRRAAERVANRVETRVTRELKDSVAAERSSARVGGRIVVIERRRANGETYLLPLLVGSTYSDERATRTFFDGAKTVRIGENETRADAVGGREPRTDAERARLAKIEEDYSNRKAG